MICRKWVRVLLYLQRGCRRIIYLDRLSGMSIHSFAQDGGLGFNKFVLIVGVAIACFGFPFQASQA